jgi:hypothetical protein
MWGMKRFLAFLLAVLLLLSTVTPAMAGQVFPDVKSGHWAERDIAKMKAKGIVAGFADGYHPLEAISREQAIVMIIRTMGKAEEAAGKVFPSNFNNPNLISAWAKEPVALALELGLLSQEDINNFRPKDATKRYEMAIFVAKALGYDSSGSNINLGFKDEKDIPEKAKAYIKAVQDAGVMQGYGDNTFGPNDPLNRAQMASLAAALDRKLDRFSSRTTYGVVFSISAGDNSILLEVDGGAIQTIPLAKDAFIYKGKSTTLSAITKGDRVAIISNEKGEGLYLEQVKATDEVAKKTVGGIITLITRTPSVNLRLSLDTGASRNYVLANSTEILIDGVRGTADNLTIGQNVSLSLTGDEVSRVEVTTIKPVEDPEENKDDLEKEEIRGIQSYLVGEIINLNSSRRTVRLADARGNTSTDVVLDIRTILIKRNEPISFGDLRVGDQLVVVGEYESRDFIASSLIVLDEVD